MHPRTRKACIVSALAIDLQHVYVAVRHVFHFTATAAHRLQPDACPGVVHSYVFKRNVLNTTRHFRTDGDAVTRADDVVPEDDVL